MSEASQFQLGQFLKEARVAKGLDRPGQLARRMHPDATQDQIGRLGARIRELEDGRQSSKELFAEMVAVLEIPAAELQPRVEEERRLLEAQRVAEREAQRIPWRLVKRVLRASIEYQEPLRRLHAWLPFPQTNTCFRFGPAKVPLPIGALFELWERSPLFRAPCPDCNGTLHAFGFGGLLSIGGIDRYCTNCDKTARLHYGGMPRIWKLVEGLLADTPFFVSGALLFAACPGERRPLVEALWSLGSKVDVPEAWLTEAPVSAIGLSLRGRKGSFFFES